MTTRRRTRGPARAARAARRVWVNTKVNKSLTIDSVDILDLLTGVAETWMLFDSTILSIKIPWLSYSMEAAAVNAVRELAWYLITGKSTLDAVDFTPPRTSGVGPSMLYCGGSSARLAATAQSFTIDLTEGTPTIDINTMRRFKENDETLWLVIENASEAGDASFLVSGLVRTLLLVP